MRTTIAQHVALADRYPRRSAEYRFHLDWIVDIVERAKIGLTPIEKTHCQIRAEEFVQEIWRRQR